MPVRMRDKTLLQIFLFLNVALAGCFAVYLFLNANDQPKVAPSSIPQTATKSNEFSKPAPLPITSNDPKPATNVVAAAATNEESRYALNGAKFELSGEGLRMIATDGHRLSFIEKKGTFVEDMKVEAIIPKKTLTELVKLSSETEETVEFGKDDNHLFFRFGKRLLVSRMLSGQFPNYEMVLPKENKQQFVIESQRIAAAVRRVALMADERSHAIKFEVSEGQLNITAQASDVGEAGETLPIEYTGDSMSSGFNAQYVNDFFGVINEGEVRFEFKDGNSQVQLRSVADSDYDFRYVIMPMRL